MFLLPLFQIELLKNSLSLTSGPTEPDDVLRATQFVLHDQPKLLEAAVELLDRLLPSNPASTNPSTSTINVPKTLYSIQKIIHEESNRTFYKIKAPSSSSFSTSKEKEHEKEKYYICFNNFCSCHSYYQSFKSSSYKHEIQNESTLFCKHLLLILLVDSMKLTSILVIPSLETFAQLFSSSYMSITSIGSTNTDTTIE